MKSHTPAEDRQLALPARPSYASVTADEALRLDWTGYHVSAKADGVCVRREWNGAAVWGDSLPDGRLMVWEIDTFQGRDIRAAHWPEREAALRELFKQMEDGRWKMGADAPANTVPNWHRVAEADMVGHCCRNASEAAQQHRPTPQDVKNLGVSRPQKFIAAQMELARLNHTPDVAVAKPIAAPFGVGLVKIKLYPTHDVTVTNTGGGKLSVGISYQGQPAGRVTVRDLNVLERLNVGDVIEISGTLLPSGKFREPKFMRPRPDKR